MNDPPNVSGNTRKFAERVIGTFGVRVLMSVIGVFSGVIIARRLGSGAVGIISALNVMVLLAITVGNFGMPSSITFLVARNNAAARRVLTSAIGFGTLAGVLISVLIVLGIWIRPELMGEVPFRLVLIACVALPFQMVSYLCLAVHLGLERIRTYNLLDLAIQSMTLLGALVIIIALGLGVDSFVAFGAVANVAVCVVIITISVAATSGSVDHNVPVLGEMFRYGTRFFVALAAGIIILRGDLLIVNYFRSPQEAGVYAVATQASIFLHTIPNVISTILFPRSAGIRDKTGAVTCRVTRHSVVLLLLLCVAAAPCAFILPYLYGPEFTDLPAIFLILLPGVFLLGLETIQVQHFAGLGLPRRIPLYWVITLVLVIGVDLLAVPRWGAWGAAAVSTASYALIFVLVARLFRVETGRSFREAFLLRMDELRGIADLSIFRTVEGDR